ncbi:MAG: 2-oxoacid:acceptor oxidoreductase family protein, partial [Sedimentisphaerales bacterium]|nr:2-oxoacid:acceptor oxidoreductase family protein [Sedimentisphaerales bacterium]
GHGVIHKLIAEAIDDLDIQDRCVVISPVGCAVFAYYYFDTGNVQSAHGRAPAVGTGISRACDDAVVISYQGDGDLASIGLNETIQAANRGEKMAVIFVNNTVYGMTGGQMAPTTLIGEVTVTTPDGRDPQQAGYPLHMCEMLSTLKSPVYIERVAVSDINHIRKARKAIRKALEIQKDGKGYAFVEILTVCPVTMKLDAQSSVDFINNTMVKEFPLGVFADRSDDASPFKRPQSDFTLESLNKIYSHELKAMSNPITDPDYGTICLRASGFGGQGLLSMGLILAQAGCKALRHVSWLPAYGPEQRGGTSNCSVVISGQPVGSPAFINSDVLIALNAESLAKFSPEVKPGGIICYDASLKASDIPAGVKAIAIPALELSQQAGFARAANIFMLGIICSLDIYKIKKEHFLQSICDMFAGNTKLIAENHKIFDMAIAWAKTNLRQP